MITEAVFSNPDFVFLLVLGVLGGVARWFLSKDPLPKRLIGRFSFLGGYWSILVMLFAWFTRQATQDNEFVPAFYFVLLMVGAIFADDMFGLLEKRY